MNKFIKSWTGRAVGWVLIVTFVWVLTAVHLTAESASDGDFCERVLLTCVAEAIIAGLFSLGASFAMFLSFCLIGYDFCERYIERYM